MARPAKDHREPPVAAPNSGGNGAASDAPGGQDQSGRSGRPRHRTAIESNNGTSSTGSGNSPGGG